MRAISLLLSILLLSGCQEKKTEPIQPPNIVFIMLDDLGVADLGCYGSTEIKTPHIDQLIKEGLKFTQAYSGATVCGPARSTLMTGLHMGHTFVRKNSGGVSLPDSAYTMAEMFKEAGYATGGFGKWGIGEIGTEGVPEKQGFDEFVGYYHQIHAHDYYPDYLYENSKKINLSNQEGDNDYTAYTIFDRTQQFIEKNKDQPFFCYAAWTLPHGRYMFPESDPALDLYKDKDWTEQRIIYAAMVTLADQHVGKIVQQLKDLNIYDNTLLIFCSDNGGDLKFAKYKTNGDLRGHKRELYEGGLRVPMIATWPRHITPGSTLDMSIYFPDMMPTFAEAIKKEVPKEIDGISILPWMKDPKKKQRSRYLYWEYPGYDRKSKSHSDSKFVQALRVKNWKMIRNGKDKDWEFYDLFTDPNETDDMAAYHPAKMKKYKEWIKKNRVEPMAQIEPEGSDGKPFR